MRILIALLVLTHNICFGQQSLNKDFSIAIAPTDSVTISSPFKDKAKRDSIDHKYSNWHQRARALEKYLLAIDNPGIARDESDRVEIKLLNGQTIKLELDSNSDEKDFAFTHHFKQLKLLLFRVQWGEGNNYALIDQMNGKKTYIIGRPFFFHDKKFMMAINCDLEAQYSSNGFELFELVNRDFKKIWKYDPMTWGPVDLKWLDSSVMVCKNRAIDTSDYTEKTTYIKIEMKRIAD